MPLLATAQTPGVQQAVDQAVDTFEDKRLSPLSLTEQIKLVDSIITAINDLLMRSTRPAGSLHLEVITTLKTTLQELLIDLRAQRDTPPTPSPSPTPAPVIIETPSSTTPPQTPQPVSAGAFATSIPTIQITHQPLLLLGGQITPPVTNFEMVASGEDILVKELSILINGDHRALNSLALYDDSGKIIAQKKVSSDIVSFK